ncbi:ATP-binding protein [Kutzneria buriramensis]|uniref:histidine kinase n=1 Tax=Kutzneria buriramensis TaxID=1045776 RepID=A0A3E0I5C0_9PSEU|nr:ATP-binding protein [Kutzneria buriramensis]REH53954.1 phospho-acceptor domain-containing protein [Kutzneria buriramensis]
MSEFADISRLVITGPADGILAVNRKGVIQLCNKAAEDLFARPADALIGAEFGHPIAPNGVFEIDLILPGGQVRVVEMRIIITTTTGEQLRQAVLRDVTHPDVEYALERQNIVLAVAAHELRSPLAAISLLAHVLRDNETTLARQRRVEIIERIISRTVYAQALVRKLLTASRIDAGGSPVIESVSVFEVVVEQLAEIAQRRDHLRVSVPDGLVAVVDRAEFRQMLTNYLENALSYGEPPVEIAARATAGWIEIRVTDHGPGVPASFVARLFERFSRGPGSERRGEGTGLGLWIVRNLARANGGEAWYEPGHPHGSRFCLRLRQAGVGRAISG